MTLLEWSWAGYPGRFMTPHWDAMFAMGQVYFYPIGYRGPVYREVGEVMAFATLRDLARYLGQRPSQIHGEVKQP